MTFQDFWQLYPRKVGKKAAEREYKRLTVAEIAEVAQALPNHIRHWRGTDIQFIPHPRTWLHQGRFSDELPAPQKTDSEKWLEALLSDGQQTGDRAGICANDGYLQPATRDAEMAYRHDASRERDMAQEPLPISREVD